MSMKESTGFHAAGYHEGVGRLDDLPYSWETKSFAKHNMEIPPYTI